MVVTIHCVLKKLFDYFLNHWRFYSRTCVHLICMEGSNVKAREQKRREWIGSSDTVEILERDRDDFLIDVF